VSLARRLAIVAEVLMNNRVKVKEARKDISPLVSFHLPLFGVSSPPLEE
jgi:hypothetical protein